MFVVHSYPLAVTHRLFELPALAVVSKIPTMKFLGPGTESAVRNFLARIPADIPLDRALLFGSRARGEHRPNCDADVALILAPSRRRMRIQGAKATFARLSVLAVIALLPSACGQSAGAPTLRVDAAASRTPINPDIYGIVSYGLDPAFAQEIRVPNIRWGGDATSRYNWEVDSGNAGFDWYFMGSSGVATAPMPGASPDLMVNTYKSAHTNVLMTIPILPYVNKSYAWSCSFPVSAYGNQTATNPYVFPVINGVTETCGNGIATIATKGSTQLLDHDILANHIPNTTVLQQGWVRHLVGAFGTAATGGIKFYQLDNEPLGWSNTHRDVQPTTPTYATVAQLGQAYAAAIKQIDGSALVMGPSDFTLGGWVGTAGQQEGLWAGEYYLQQMAAYERTNQVRVLDYFDEHYYFDTSTPAAQLASTRSLWDPNYNGGTWVEKYAFKGPMHLIPRFKKWIDTYYPGTKLALSEYSIDSGKKSIVDAIAQMDVLGIFGREQLDFANMWIPPAPTEPIAYSFRMFRNYDGNGHEFGDTSLGAVSSDPGSLSLYAAQRTSDNAVTLIAINKTTASITSSISLAHLSAPPAAEVYVYSAANLKAIVHASDAAISAGNLTYTFPGYSAVMFVIQANPSATRRQ
jgi:predicted nucleotidyltransferase